MAFLRFIQDGDCLALETGTEPCSQFWQTPSTQFPYFSLPSA